jgi:hypothetical protein
MSDKIEASVKKLEGEFHDFKKEWEKFRKNDFSHLVENVNGLRGDVNTSIGHIVALVEDRKAIEKSIQAIDKNVLELLRRIK